MVTLVTEIALVWDLPWKTVQVLYDTCRVRDIETLCDGPISRVERVKVIREGSPSSPQRA